MVAGLPSGAVVWPVNWIAHPCAEGSEQIWFCRSFSGEGRTVAGQIEMAVGGGAVLYVNGYNVTADVPIPVSGVWRPLAAGEEATVVAARYDVTRYLRPDTNVVAVWCAPEARLSLVFSGLRVTHGGRRAEPFVHTTDATWLCRTCGSRISPDGRERVDGRETQEELRTASLEVIKWLNAREIAPILERGKIMEVVPLRSAVRVGHVDDCCLTEVAAGRLTYSCGRGFRGRIRVTLRGMRRGDLLDIGGMGYVCSGESDEQAIMRFTEYVGDSVIVSGGPDLTPDNVQSVEAISLEEYFNSSWMY